MNPTDDQIAEALPDDGNTITAREIAEKINHSLFYVCKRLAVMRQDGRAAFKRQKNGALCYFRPGDNRHLSPQVRERIMYLASLRLAEALGYHIPTPFTESSHEIATSHH